MIVLLFIQSKVLAEIYTASLTYLFLLTTHYSVVRSIPRDLTIMFIIVSVFTAKGYKLTPWQFTASGDWLGEHKYRQIKICQILNIYTFIYWLNYWYVCMYVCIYLDLVKYCYFLKWRNIRKKKGSMLYGEHLFRPQMQRKN